MVDAKGRGRGALSGLLVASREKLRRVTRDAVRVVACSVAPEFERVASPPHPSE